MSDASWCCTCFCVVLCVSFCTSHFVMVPLNWTYPHCLQHSFFNISSIYIGSVNKVHRVLTQVTAAIKTHTYSTLIGEKNENKCIDPTLTRPHKQTDKIVNLKSRKKENTKHESRLSVNNITGPWRNCLD